MFNNLNLKTGFVVSSGVTGVIFLTSILLMINVFDVISINQPDMSFIVYASLLAMLILSSVISILIFSAATKPYARLKKTLQNINDGDFESRTGVKGTTEFGQIGELIDRFMSERISDLTKIEEENEQLNDSVVALLETVAQIAQKNLAIKAQVNEDITGPLADALNMLTTETSSVLHEVTRISSDVAETSNLVKKQSDNVLLLADNERDQIDSAIRELKDASTAINKIASLAETSNEAAETAIRSNINAMSTVTDTVESINNIRETIHESEKRIKRLGERSQEISSAVNLINNISERTHILALNASMHAASAGEAGKGFAVVADEVQRLAESAKESTTQISTLVNNIQVETSGVVNTMNEVISKVVGGSQMAEQAGEKMKETQSTTAELVSMVQSIASSASDQSRNSIKLRNRTDSILESVNRTGKHLREQTRHTDELVEQAMSLVTSVGVFKLKNLNEEQLDA